MSCNPCCCWRLKDAVVTIGIWSFLYALASVAMYGWQWGVLSQCQHVTMAQSNLQCEYYCPCVGASTARTSAIIEGKIYNFIQLGIFGWQMAAIKYEKDRAANTLLPNYNTYGRYDIPSYYESYWQSPEERYYTALFVVQILCLIVAFFFLFASVALIYGVHTWSRYLLWPWLVCMLCSILTSLAYCITWWSGDVRDYWLVLTILQFFGVIINCYCFVVVWVFYNRMDDELKYYEGRKLPYDPYATSNAGIVEGDEDEAADGGYPPDWPGAAPAWPQEPPQPKWASRMPPERFDQIPRDPDFRVDEPRPRSVPPFHTPVTYDDFADVPRHAHGHRRRRRCSCCDHAHRHRHRRRTCGHERAHRSRTRLADSLSSSASTDLTGTEESVSTRPDGRRHRHRTASTRRRSCSRPHTCGAEVDLAPHRSQRSAVVQVGPEDLGEASCAPPAAGGFTIPQHIVIPPDTGAEPGQPRKYQINSEITISYDPHAPPEPRQPIGSITSNV